MMSTFFESTSRCGHRPSSLPRGNLTYSHFVPLKGRSRLILAAPDRRLILLARCAYARLINSKNQKRSYHREDKHYRSNSLGRVNASWRRCNTVVGRRRFPRAALDLEITGLVLAFEFGVRLIQGVLFVLLWFLVWLTGIRWRQYALGISTGFGAHATFTLLASLLRSEFGTRFNSLFVYGSPMAYILALLIWLWYYSSPQPPDPERDAVPPLSREDLDHYLTAIRKIRGS
jgi:hypothetical protein